MTTYLTLNTGAKLPALGFGTWQDVDAQYDAVKEALKVGYRHIDTAQAYGTEAAVGKAIKESNVPRSDLFLTTKLWNSNHHPEDVEKSLDKSLKDLQTDYVDLFLMHWPVAFGRGADKFPKKDGKMILGDTHYVDTYKALLELVKTGKARAVGVSNFSQTEIERIIQETGETPSNVQIELHPYFQQTEFVNWLKSKDIIVTAYSPFGNQNEVYDSDHHKLIEDKVLVDIGKKHDKSGSQAALAWGLTSGHSVIPKSKTPKYIAQNFDSDFKLSQSELDDIRKLDKDMRLNNPSENFRYKFYQN